MPRTQPAPRKSWPCLSLPSPSSPRLRRGVDGPSQAIGLSPGPLQDTRSLRQKNSLRGPVTLSNPVPIVRDTRLHSLLVCLPPTPVPASLRELPGRHGIHATMCMRTASAGAGHGPDRECRGRLGVHGMGALWPAPCLERDQKGEPGHCLAAGACVFPPGSPECLPEPFVGTTASGAVEAPGNPPRDENTLVC